MEGGSDFFDELFRGLKALAESSFPKKCGNCGRVFETAEQFLRETEGMGQAHTGLKEARDDDGSRIVEVFRNCPCGSTLLDFFSDRRDLSDKGMQRRKRFEELHGFLVSNGLDPSLARAELIKVLRGEKSEVLAKIRPPSGRTDRP